MEWAVDSCATDRSARIVPYWNDAPFPNFAVDLLNLLPVGSPSRDQLSCYENSLSITHYDDSYFTMLAPGAADPVDVCSVKYPSSSTAAAQAQAQGQPNDRLLQQAASWPTHLFTKTVLTMATPAPVV